MASAAFEELDYRATPMGELSLRRRRVRSMDGGEVYEVKLGGEFLMSSLVNEAELALATIPLSMLGAREVDVLVGGLGLGYTANAALDHPQTRSVTVVEYMDAVIDWHQQGLVPLGPSLCGDKRCRLLQGDFFELMVKPAGPSPDGLDASYDAILVDIDHSPACVLHPSHADFYQVDGLQRAAERLPPGGVFALWSADVPEPGFLEALSEAFATATAHEVRFFNPLLNEEDRNTIYVGHRG